METTYTYIPSLSDQLPEIPSDSIISRTIYQDEQVKVILFGFAAGQELSEHTASKPAIIHIVSGQARISLGGDAKPYTTGAWAHLPAQMPHSILAETPVTMLLYLIQ